MKRINNFDYLRLVLALEVLVIHAYNLHFPDTLRPIIPPVSTFAVMSGLLIPQSYTDSKTWTHFAWRRLIRVYPAFIVAIALVAVLEGIRRVPATLLGYLSAGLLGAGSADRALWSLMVDEVCYAWHPISRLKGLWSPKICTFLMTLMLALSCVPKFPGRVILGLVACFFAGNLMYFWKDRIPKIPTWAWVAALFATTVACFLTIDGPVFQFFSLPASVLPIIAMLRIPQGRLPIPDLSYGTYVYHLPILYALDRTGAIGWPLALLTTGCTLVFSVASWYGVEAPALKLKDWSPGRSKSPGDVAPAKSAS